MVKIGAELPKLSQNKTGYPFFGPPCRCKKFDRFVSICFIIQVAERQKNDDHLGWLSDQFNVYFFALTFSANKFI